MTLSKEVASGRVEPQEEPEVNPLLAESDKAKQGDDIRFGELPGTADVEGEGGTIADDDVVFRPGGRRTVVVKRDLVGELQGAVIDAGVAGVGVGAGEDPVAAAGLVTPMVPLPLAMAGNRVGGGVVAGEDSVLAPAVEAVMPPVL
jgi:hypothetical protein